MQTDEVFRVSDLTRYIQQVLTLNFESSFWIEAEINQISSSRGNYYLELIEKDPNSDEILAAIQGRLWRSKQHLIRRKLNDEISNFLQPGMRVKLRGRIDFHSVYGLAFHIDDIDQDFTIGELDRQKKEVIRRLTTEGIFELNKQLELQPVLQRIAVISSRTAAGYADFTNQLQHNEHDIPFQLHLYHCSVQGVNAVSEITAALDRIESNHMLYDAICILRGGGSKLDLSAFDHELLARKIGNMSVPVVTGIGHEVDLSVADMTAHTYLKTPTALAAFLIDRNAGYLNENYLQYQATLTLAKDHLHVATSRLNTVLQRCESLVRHQVQAQRNALNQNWQKSRFHSQTKLIKYKQQVEILALKAESADPSHVLARGFALVSQENKIVKSGKTIKKSSPLTLLFHDGKVNAVKS